MFIRSFRSSWALCTTMSAGCVYNILWDLLPLPKQINSPPRFATFSSVIFSFLIHEQPVLCRVSHLALTSAYAQYPALFFPCGSSSHQGHVLLCVLAWSVSGAAAAENSARWCGIYKDNKQIKMVLLISFWNIHQNAKSFFFFARFAWRWIYLETQPTSRSSVSCWFEKDVTWKAPVFVSLFSWESGETLEANNGRAVGLKQSWQDQGRFK